MIESIIKNRGKARIGELKWSERAVSGDGYGNGSANGHIVSIGGYAKPERA